MEEKYMVNDTLTNIKSEILAFTDFLINSENGELQQTLMHLRSILESFYTEFFTLALSKGYRYTVDKAKPEEISRVKNLFI